MRRLALTQLILGALVVALIIYLVGVIAPGYHALEGFGPGGIIIQARPKPVPEHGLLEWIVLSVSLGLAVTICGIAQIFKPTSKGLASIQIVLGAICILSFIWFLSSLEPNYGSYTKLIQGYGEIKLNPLPGWLPQLLIWKGMSAIAMIAILVTGVIQQSMIRQSNMGESFHV